MAKTIKGGGSKGYSILKSRIWMIALAVLIAIIAIISILIIYTREPAVKNDYDINIKSRTYFMYTYSCQQDESYFMNLSALVYGIVNKTYVIELKEFKGCVASNKTKISDEKFEDLYCDCVEWHTNKTCIKGFTLGEAFCINNVTNEVSPVLRPCSRYYCKNGEVVDAVYEY